MSDYLDPTEKRQRELERRREQSRQLISDLSEIMAVPAGRRVMRRILAALGYGQYLTADAADVAKFNFAQALAANMLQADEAAAREILSETLWRHPEEN